MAKFYMYRILVSLNGQVAALQSLRAASVSTVWSVLWPLHYWITSRWVELSPWKTGCLSRTGNIFTWILNKVKKRGINTCVRLKSGINFPSPKFQLLLVLYRLPVFLVKWSIYYRIFYLVSCKRIILKRMDRM